jgi:ADP-ribose pyrophosphatase
MKKRQIVDSKIISETPQFRLFKQTLKTAAGEIQPHYYLIEAEAGVVVVPVTKTNTLLLVKQYRHGIGEVLLELPSGSIDEGETPQEAAERELLEETGSIAATIESLGHLTPTPATSTQRAEMFLARGVVWKKPQELDSTEEIEVVELTLPEVIEKIVKGEIWASDTLAAILLYVLKQQKGKKWG